MSDSKKELYECRIILSYPDAEPTVYFQGEVFAESGEDAKIRAMMLGGTGLSGGDNRVEVLVRRFRG